MVLKLVTLTEVVRNSGNSSSAGKLWFKLSCLEITTLVNSWSKDVEGTGGTDTAKTMCCVLVLSGIKCPLKCHGFCVFFSVIMILTSETALVLVTKGNI